MLRRSRLLVLTLTALPWTAAWASGALPPDVARPDVVVPHLITAALTACALVLGHAYLSSRVSPARALLGTGMLGLLIDAALLGSASRPDLVGFVAAGTALVTGSRALRTRSTSLLTVALGLGLAGITAGESAIVTLAIAVCTLLTWRDDHTTRAFALACTAIGVTAGMLARGSTVMADRPALDVVARWRAALPSTSDVDLVVHHGPLGVLSSGVGVTPGGWSVADLAVVVATSALLVVFAFRWRLADPLSLVVTLPAAGATMIEVAIGGDGVPLDVLPLLTCLLVVLLATPGPPAQHATVSSLPRQRRDGPPPTARPTADTTTPQVSSAPSSSSAAV